MKFRRGTYAWILASPLCPERIQGYGPANGNPKSMDSYHPELAGLIAMIFLLQTLTETHSITSGTIIIACDNESAVGTIVKLLIH